METQGLRASALYSNGSFDFYPLLLGLNPSSANNRVVPLWVINCLESLGKVPSLLRPNFLIHKMK